MGGAGRAETNAGRIIIYKEEYLIMEKEQLLIIKIGGNIVDDARALQQFLASFAGLRAKKMLVHGGGKIATRLADDLGLQVHMVEGRRITDQAMLDIVTMVYAGLSNKNIIAGLQMHGVDAIGLSGADGNAIRCIKRPVREIDYGFVGDIMEGSVNTALIKSLLESGLSPVFSAITHDGAGQLLNTNADTIASALAVAMASQYRVSLVYCFEKKGVLRDVNDDASLIPEIKNAEFERLKADGIVADGMIPKLENAFDAISSGVSEVYIGHAGELVGLQKGRFGTRMVQ